MTQRKKAEGTIFLSHVEIGIDSVDLVTEIGMGEHHTFGVPRCSRCINEGSDIIR